MAENQEQRQQRLHTRAPLPPRPPPPPPTLRPLSPYLVAYGNLPEQYDPELDHNKVLEDVNYGAHLQQLQTADTWNDQQIEDAARARTVVAQTRIEDNNAFLLDALARMRKDILETIETINLRFQVLDAKQTNARRVAKAVDALVEVPTLATDPRTHELRPRPTRAGDVTSFAGVLRMSERNMKTWLHYYGTVVPDQASPTEVFELLKDALGF